MNDYYRAKPAGCVDSILSQLRTAPRSKSDPSTMIGFLAQLFVTSPSEKQRILAAEPSDYVRSVDLVALYRAGLLDDSRNFADRNRLSAMLQQMQASQLKPLAAVRPLSNAADNDLLIGAYMASGDAVFIQRILENFSSADDGMVSDAMRLGFMKSRFGPTFTPKGRDNVMAPAACAKYQCKADLARFLRMLTLSSAFWAVQSLAQQDDGVKKTFAGFFAHDARLKNLLASEQAALGNYITALTILTAPKLDQVATDAGAAHETMSKVASAYENLEPAGNVFSHIETLARSGKKAN